MQKEKAQTLNCMHDQQAVLYPFRKKAHPRTEDLPQLWEPAKINDTLNAFDQGDMRTPTVVAEQHVFENHSQDARYVPLENISETVAQKYGTGGNNQPLVAERFIRWIVRRLTPLECTRLQGFPDGWVEIGEWVDSKGKKHKDADSPKYKALGNSIAIPFWLWMTRRMSAYLPDGATLGSLFCGIGGFDLCWEYVHGPGTSRWCSEIEPFPIAVMKKHFGDEDTVEEGDIWR